MAATIVDNTVIIVEKTRQRASIFLRTMADEIVNISSPKTPKKTGRLRADVIRQVLGLNGKLKWVKKYAKYQEVRRFAKYTTSGTGPRFAENAVKKSVAQTGKIAKRSGLI